MSYVIQYKGNGEKKFQRTVNRWNVIKRFSKLICAIIIVILFMIQPIRVIILNLILPGDSATTCQAAETMIGNIENGHSFKEAFTDFCIEILENA